MRSLIKSFFILALLISSLNILNAQTDNLYDRLGVPRNANQEEIKKAYRDKSKIYHTDKIEAELNNSSLSPKEKDSKRQEYKDLFSKIAEAYAILSNEQARAEYDRTGVIDPKFIKNIPATDQLFEFKDVIKNGELELTENEIRSYIDNKGNLFYIEKGVFPSFDQKISDYLNRLGTYLVNLEKTTALLPEVITPDIEAEVIKILKENGCKTPDELNKEFMEIEQKKANELDPYIEVYKRKHHQSINLSLPKVADIEPLESIDEFHKYIDETINKWDKWIEKYEKNIKELSKATSSLLNKTSDYVSNGKTEILKDGTVQFIGEKIPEGNVSVRKIFLMDKIARYTLLITEKAKQEAYVKDFRIKSEALKILKKVFSSNLSQNERTSIIYLLEESELKNPNKQKNTFSSLAKTYLRKGKLHETDLKNLTILTEDIITPMERLNPEAPLVVKEPINKEELAKKRATLKVKKEEFKKYKNNEAKLTPEEQEKFKNLEAEIKRLKTETKIVWPRSVMMTAEYFKGFSTFYIAMLSQRLMNTLTGGYFASNIFQKYEAENNKAEVEVNGVLGAGSLIWKELTDPYFHISFASFSFVSYGVQLGAAQTKIMKEMTRSSYRNLYPTWNKTYLTNYTIKSIALPAISMTLGMWAAQIVPQYIQLFSDLHHENEAIRSAAWELFRETNLSLDAFARVGTTMASFLMAEAIVSDRAIHVTKIMLEGLKKRKCKDLYSRIQDLNRAQLNPKPSFLKQTGKMIIVFNLAEIINHYTFYQLFPGIFNMDKIMALNINLANIEKEVFLDVLFSTAPDPTDEELEYIYNKYDNLPALQQIIKVLRQSPKTVKEALSYLKKPEDKQKVLNIFDYIIGTIFKYNKQESLDNDPSIELLLAELSNNEQRKSNALANQKDYVGSQEHWEETLEFSKNVVVDIRTKVESPVAKEFSEKVTPNMMAESIINMEQRTILEQEFNNNLVTGNMHGAIQILNEMTSKYYEFPNGFKENIINVLTSFGEKNGSLLNYQSPENNVTLPIEISNSPSTYAFSVDNASGYITDPSSNTYYRYFTEKDVSKGLSGKSKNDFEFLGYLMVNLYPMMMEPRYLDEDGYPNDHIPWRANIMLLMATNIHQKILASSNYSDYTKGMSNVYDLIDIYINNIPEEVVEKADMTNTKLLTAYLMIQTLKKFGLPEEKEDFLNKRSKK